MIATKLNKIDLDRARRALEADGYTIFRTSSENHLDFKKGNNRGTVFSDGRIFTDQSNTFQRLYSAQTIKDASKRFGWRVANQTTTKQGTIQIQLKR